MRFLAVFACCLSVFAQGKNNPFSLDNLTGFYEDYVCEGKNTLTQANLTGGCAVFWVSPSGSDANPGTEDAPFLTLQRAQEAVRALPSSAFQDQDVYVYLKEGTYRLQEPLSLDVSDSGRNGYDVVYSAAPNEDPVISGAVQVTGWSLYDPMLGIYRAPVGAYSSRQLYVNGARAERARTTSYPAGFLPNYSVGGIEFIPTSLNPTAWQNPSAWTNWQDIEAVIITQWRMMRVPLSTIIPYSGDPLFPGLIELQEPAWNNANVYYDISTNKPGFWSFWQVTWFENALQFLTEPGQWYLDSVDQWLYYLPLPGENIFTADVELPILETLIVGQGSLGQPIHNIRFEGLTFSGATWLTPSSSDGYVSDQSAQILLGSDHSFNYIGHDQNVNPTPGNISFSFADQITFYGNIFEHLGGVGLQFGLGSTNNTIKSNLFTDISSSAIEIGAVTLMDSHPTDPGYILSNNSVSNNLISGVAVEFSDAAGIFVGFTQFTTLFQNTITNVPWSGIAMGWGWGLLDVPSFPGLPHAYSGEWGTYTGPTPNYGSRILQNKITNFINVMWDGGAIYTTGQQGPSLGDGLVIQGNVAYGKLPSGGGNAFYTDGGSRYIQVSMNASYDNPIGITNYGPAPSSSDPFYLFYPGYYLLTGEPYGSDTGGCVTYGDINYSGNYWLESPLPIYISNYNDYYHSLLDIAAYNANGFFDICPYSSGGVSYPVNLTYLSNTAISSQSDIPSSILSNAGVQSRPSTIPASRWVLPP